MRYLAVAMAVVASAPNSAVAQVLNRPDSPASRLVVPSAAPVVEPAPDEPEPAPSEFEPPPTILAAPRLVPIPPDVARTRSRYHWPLWRILTGSALVVGGGVLFGYGMSAFAYDGICVPTPPPGVLACRRYYDTKDKGIALTTSGVLTAVGGLLMATIPSRRSRPKLTAQFLLPNLGIALGGNF